MALGSCYVYCHRSEATWKPVRIYGCIWSLYRAYQPLDLSFHNALRREFPVTTVLLRDSPLISERRRHSIIYALQWNRLYIAQNKILKYLKDLNTGVRYVHSNWRNRLQKPENSQFGNKFYIGSMRRDSYVPRASADSPQLIFMTYATLSTIIVHGLKIVLEI